MSTRMGIAVVAAAGPPLDRGLHTISSGEVAMKAAMERIAVRVAAGPAILDGDLDLPPMAKGVVVFAHGSGSSRHSPRNRHVAEVLNEHALGTLLVDLLTAEEEREDSATAALRFDINLLTQRLAAVADWLSLQSQTKGRPLGLFGASTGAAAALRAAVRRPKQVRAVVSRGGRPDLAGAEAALVRVPTLLIVGGNDLEVLELNRQAMARMRCETRLEIVPGATHLFEEPGALAKVAKLAAWWLGDHLR